MHHIFFVFSSFFSGEYILVCPPGKSSRLQRMVLFFFFFFFFSPCLYFSNIFFLFEQNLPSCRARVCVCRVCVCSFCVLCLAFTMTDQMQSLHRVAFLLSPSTHIFFFSFLFWYWAEVNERRCWWWRTNCSFFSSPYIQTNSADSVSITNMNSTSDLS